MKKKRDIHAKSQQVRSNQSLIINYMVGIGIFFLELLLYLKYNFVFHCLFVNFYGIPLIFTLSFFVTKAMLKRSINICVLLTLVSGASVIPS